jgi:glycine/D-amino acid oxidase-like deaminating enzyme
LSKSPPEAPPKNIDDRATAIDRRGFLTSGAAGAVAMAAVPTQAAQAQEPLRWDREVDVVVIGAGAGGLVAAIAAREKGASVVIVEKNFDIGGRAMMSFGGLYIGGGNRMQKAIGVEDSPDRIFADWSRPEKPMGRFSDRALVRTHADNSLEMFDWLRSTASNGKPTGRRGTGSTARARGSTWCAGRTSRRRQRAARASCVPWRKPRGKWASTSCSSAR